MADGPPAARTTLRTGYVRVLVFCRSCRHQADADLRAIVEAGRGDVPLTDCCVWCERSCFSIEARAAVSPMPSKNGIATG
ncbi:MAG TPA: hypothetical protein VNW50_17320, partial [Streptosporangiaceae bacterium]|nr:hypothetical protein [Streptosporangiaceae bacterium]